MAEVQVRRVEGLTHEGSVRGHTVTIDEPAAGGGNDRGPAPHELIAIALGACTAMTLTMYAGKKGWPLEKADVSVVRRKKDDGSAAFDRAITLHGALDDGQRQRLLEIANMCPVFRTLTGQIEIPSTIT